MRVKPKRLVCVLLPNKQRLDCAVRVKARGREVLDSVLRQLGVCDLQVFGLAALRDNEYLFLDLEQKLSKYFGKRWSRGSAAVPFIVFLRVQHYVESGQLILSSKVRRLYYAELRQKALRSQSRHQEALLLQLAASALQAEVGDLERSEGNGDEGGERKRRHYFLPEDFFPSWLIKRHGRDFLLRHCPELHGELRGVSRSHAMLRFMREASALQDGPVTVYRMRQEVEGKSCLLYDFSWTDIDRFTVQGSRFEIAAVGSLCLPKLVYYTHSAFHSKHVLRHLRDSHQVHISTRDVANYIQQLEDMQASQFYTEAYVCDVAHLRQRLQSLSLTSSMSDCSGAVGTAWSKEEEDRDSRVTESEWCTDDPEEAFVDDPAEVSWLAELVHGVSVDGPLELPSSWAAVTMEMKQVLRRRDDEGVSVD